MTTELPHQLTSNVQNNSRKRDRKRVPTEIIYHRTSRALELVYPDQSSIQLSSEFLRVHSPSAEVRGHTPDQAKLQYGKKNINILQIVLQGSYAIRISFDDEHDTGVYTWHYLWELAENQTTYWQEYLQALLTAGKSR
jgi:DUF971 family protein